MDSVRGHAKSGRIAKQIGNLTKVQQQKAAIAVVTIENEIARCLLANPLVKRLRLSKLKAHEDWFAGRFIYKK